MLKFDPILPLWLLMLLLLAMTSVLSWMEWKRKLRFLVWRLASVFIMMSAVAGIFLRPHFNFNRTGSVLLLTPGYPVKAIDTLIAARPDLQIMHTPSTKPFRGSTRLSSYYALRDIEQSVEFVAGEGLPLYALDLLTNRNFVFIPGDIPEGVVDLRMPNQIFANRRNIIAGTFRNTSDTHWIILSGPGGKEDSVNVSTKKSVEFSLGFTPRQTGNLLYTLSITDASGVGQTESIPLTVVESSPLRVLVILNYPTFETTFLKNFIASKGNEVVIRSQLSKNNFSYEYINHAPLRFSTLTKNTLDEFDLLIADGTTLQNLSASESMSLKESIRSGLGLLPLYDVPPKETSAAGFFPFTTIRLKSDTTTVTTGSKQLTLPALPFRIVDQAPLQKVLTNKSGTLTGYTFSGKGKIGFQLLRETYRMALAGDTISYANLWSPLIERTARQDKQAASVVITTPFPYYVDEPVHLRITASSESPMLLMDSVRIPLREDVLLDDIWHATVWPLAQGWHSFVLDEEKMQYFVSGNDDWHTLTIANRIRKNGLTIPVETQGKPTTETSRRISSSWFYLFFLIAAGFLWLAPKL